MHKLAILFPISSATQVLEHCTWHLTMISMHRVIWFQCDLAWLRWGRQMRSFQISRKSMQSFEWLLSPTPSLKAQKMPTFNTSHPNFPIFLGLLRRHYFWIEYIRLEYGDLSVYYSHNKRPGLFISWMAPARRSLSYSLSRHHDKNPGACFHSLYFYVKVILWPTLTPELNALWRFFAAAAPISSSNAAWKQ